MEDQYPRTRLQSRSCGSRGDGDDDGGDDGDDDDGDHEIRPWDMFDLMVALKRRRDRSYSSSRSQHYKFLPRRHHIQSLNLMGHMEKTVSVGTRHLLQL